MTELYHYGVKGMKWGVRRTSEQLGRLRKSNKRIEDELNEVDKYSPFINKKQRKVFKDFWERDNARLNKTYDDFSDDRDLHLKPGTKFVRISSKQNEDLSKKQYVSYKPTDIDRYTSIMPTLNPLVTGKKYVDMYKNTLVSDVPVVSPSSKKRIDTFLEMIKNDKTLRDEFAVYSQRFNDGKDVLSGDRILEELSNPEMSNVASGKYYLQFQQQYFMDNKMNNEYTKRLIDRGYNAIVDDNDFEALSKTPLILLDNNNVKQISSERLSDKDISDAIDRSYKRIKR